MKFAILPFVLALALTGAAPVAPARAADVEATDIAAMHAYPLSIVKVKAYGAALTEYGAALKSDAALKAETETMAKDVTSLSGMAAKIGAAPHVLAFFTKHGLTAEDAVFIPVVMGSAKMAAGNPDIAQAFAERVSPAQIAFFKAHEAELRSQRWLFVEAPDKK